MSEPLNFGKLLAGRVALVTGAGGGVGRGIALALAAAGAKVVVAARRAATGDETVALIAAAGSEAPSSQALCIETDIAVRAQVERAVVATVAAFGGLDIVVHNASSGLSGVPVAIEDVDDERWEDESRIALDAVFFLARAAFSHLHVSGHGRFIVLSSVQGIVGGAMNPVYATVKSAQRGFVKALAREWGPSGITVNGINPAAMTPASEEHFRRSAEAYRTTLASIPLGRMGDAQRDIGGAAVALCCDCSAYVTGQIVNVNGGLHTAG